MPDDSMPSAARSAWLGGGAVVMVAILLMWAGVVLPLPLSAATFVGIVLLLVVRKRHPRLAAWGLALSPFVLAPMLSAGFATVSYFRGTARISFWGLPNSEWTSLDPTWRVYKASRGCMYSPTVDLLLDAPANATIKGLVTLLGPMPGVYTGPYPSREAAHQVLAAKGIVVPSNTLRDGYLLLAGERHRLWRSELTDELVKVESLRAAMHSDALLLVQGTVLEAETATLLVDRRNGRPFAVYYSDDVDGRLLGTSFEYKCKWERHRCTPLYDGTSTVPLK